MKKIYTSLLAVSIAVSAFATNYPGNGKTGFGGPVGPGSLDVTNVGNTITFTLNRGTGNMNDALVIYLDAVTGGFSSTANFIDATDGLSKAIAGVDGTNRAIFNFNAAFRPEYALAFKPGETSAKLVLLTEGANFTLISSPTLSNNTNNAASYTVTINATDIGLTGTVGFKFFATLISTTAYRSDEAIGDPMTGFTQGWNPYTSAVAPLVYAETLPIIVGNFNGYLKNSIAILNWNTKTEINSKNFEVQKSSNGNTWNTIATIAAANAVNGAAYSYSDISATNANNYYRLKLVDLDGSYSLSEVINVRKEAKAIIGIMGNPVKGKINLTITNETSGNYQITLYNNNGVVLNTQAYKHIGGTGNASINIPAGASGLLLVTVNDGTNNQVLKVMVQ